MAALHGLGDVIRSEGVCVCKGDGALIAFSSEVAWDCGAMWRRRLGLASRSLLLSLGHETRG